MSKQELRATYTALRATISEKKLDEASLKISNQLLNIPIWELTNYHLFLPISKKKEIDTSYILTILQGKDKNIIVPKVSDNKLHHYLLTDNTKMVISKWGIPEPQDGISISEKQLDVVFVPLMAFDAKGNRVGYGKGFYDAFLKGCRKDVIKVGLSLFESEEVISDVAPHDIPLNYCITPNRIYTF